MRDREVKQAVDKKRIVVALSGTGRSLENLLQYQKKHNTFEICGVITSTKKALGAKLAIERGIDLYWENFVHQNKASDELSLWLENKNPALIVLAGFVKIFPTSFKSLEKTQSSYRVINIHPSLLPKFSGKGMYGTRVHKAVLEACEKHSGASVHFVNEVYDEGPLISQIRVPVLKGDRVEALSSRVFEAECKLYPKTIEELLTGKLPQENPRVFSYTTEKLIKKV